jgi:hypothetical protein
LPAVIAAAAEALWAAMAALMAPLDALAPSAAAKAGSFLHVSAQVAPTAPKRNCLLLINDPIVVTVRSSRNPGL